jgi:uncharacterized cupin superfamily protein
MNSEKPIAAKKVEEQAIKSFYPEPFASMMIGRTKRKLGDYFGLTNFGINLTELEPGAMSALKHHHSKQDEFIYILGGTPTLVFGSSEYLMQAGDCFGFKKGRNIGHHLVNNSNELVVYLEIGDRTPGDKAEYPDDDLCAQTKSNGSWSFSHKDGTPY